MVGRGKGANRGGAWELLYTGVGVTTLHRVRRACRSLVQLLTPRTPTMPSLICTSAAVDEAAGSTKNSPSSSTHLATRG